MQNRTWKSGDWAIYRKTKWSATPGTRAINVVASPKGETYHYVIDKYWVVESVLPGGKLCLRTARGKTHVINVSDPNLHRPSLLRRLISADRFRTVEQRLKTAELAA